MVVQAKVGLALLGLGLFGLWYVNKKDKEQGAAEDTVDTDFEEVPGAGSSLLSSGSTLLPKSNLQNTNTKSAQADATNSLSQTYLSEPKSNLVVTDYKPKPPQKPYPDCSIISGIRLNVNRQGISGVPVLL